jgi:hypothetical protein
MLKSECPNCGSPISAFASSCAACGAPNRARFGAFAVAGSVVALVVALVVAGVLVMRWQQGAGGSTGPVDYAWLGTAMSDCDTEAQKTPDTLHFLVVPMLSAPSDDAAWKKASLNDIGNAILLRQRDTLEGLADQSLVISTDQYEFSVRDEKTSAVYKWTPSVGVKKFLVAGGVQIQEFKVQFKTQQRKNENEWGAPFVHSKGTCYWVNAIIGN